MYELLGSLEVHRFFLPMRSSLTRLFLVVRSESRKLREIKIDFQPMENPDITIGSISGVRLAFRCCYTTTINATLPRGVQNITSYMKQMSPEQITAKGNSARQLDGVNVTIHNMFFVQLYGQSLLSTQKNCTWATQTYNLSCNVASRASRL